MDINDYYRKGHTGYQASDLAVNDSRIANICQYTRKETAAGGKILDVGCGDLYLSRLMPEFTWTGVDIDETKDKRIIKQDITKTPWNFEAASFDTVICSEVLEHLFDPVSVIKEMRRVVRPSGALVLTVPNAHTFENLHGHFQSCIFDVNNVFAVEHIRLYTVQAMAKLLEPNGWKVVHFTGNSVHMSPTFREARYWMRQYFPDAPTVKIDQMIGNMFPFNSPGMLLLCRPV